MLQDANTMLKAQQSYKPSSEVCFPQFKFKAPKDHIDKAIQAFLTGRVGKYGSYMAIGNALVYRGIITSRQGVPELVQDVIAIRLDRANEVVFLGNSSILPYIGRKVSFGNAKDNRSVTDVQTRLSQYIQMVPFSVFNEASLNITKYRCIEKGDEETITRKVMKWDRKLQKDVAHDETVHFTGSCLFEVDGKTFLFDVDRCEVKHKIFNPFLVELKQAAKNIKDAYNSLKPSEVLAAEGKGFKVLRQGEWFFIPVKGKYEAETHTNRWSDDKKNKLENTPLTLKAGDNRPNVASLHAKDGKNTYVSGKVTHSGREHAPLILKGWYRAVPNTSVQSFTLTGDID